MDASTWPSNTPIDRIWPGAAYVDVLGIDGFNWGTGDASAAEKTTWRSFGEIFAPMYRILSRLDADAGIWVTEFGCAPETTGSPPGGAADQPSGSTQTRVAWLDQMLTTRAFPRLQAVVYFDIKTSRDWRLDRSPAALAAIRSRLR